VIGLRGAAAVVAVAVAGTGVAADRAQATGPQRALVRTYSPITMLREQDDPPCDNDREQFEPTTVNTVLGNPRVVLVPPAGSGEDKIEAPTAADVAGKGDGYHLDLPGDPLTPGCTYARDFAELVQSGEAPPLTYAHIRRRPEAERVVVQYWFFYYFNQFNDLHESDWEGMQLIFDATTASEALEAGPSEVGLFQHGGGERANWDDEKVRKDGEHPIVYPAAGSHATFYEDAIYIENGRRGSGVGCDNASEPLRRVVPRPVIVPTHPRPGSRFQWLTYEGRWGQREDGFNNGPTGPNTKLQWLRPLITQQTLRESSAVLPGNGIAGPTITSVFCGAIAQLSTLINLAARTPVGAALLVLGILLAIIIPLTLTRWRPVELEPLRAERTFGQMVRAARQLYGRHWLTLVPLGLTAVVIIAALDGVILGLSELIGKGIGDLLGVGTVRFELKGSLLSTGTVGATIVSAAVIVFVRELDRSGHDPGPFGAYRGLRSRFWRVLGAQLLVALATIALAITIVGLPIAIWKYIEWQFVQQQVLFEDKGIRDAFRGSTRLVRGHWFYTLRVAGFLWLLSIVAGPALGLALVFTDVPLWTINLLGSIVFALLIPYVAIARTLLYFDLRAHGEFAEAATAPPGPELRPAT
jgi:hypothetical protein